MQLSNKIFHLKINNRNILSHSLKQTPYKSENVSQTYMLCLMTMIIDRQLKPFLSIPSFVFFFYKCFRIKSEIEMKKLQVLGFMFHFIDCIPLMSTLSWNVKKKLCKCITCFYNNMLISRKQKEFYRSRSGNHNNKMHEQHGKLMFPFQKFKWLFYISN